MNMRHSGGGQLPGFRGCSAGSAVAEKTAGCVVDGDLEAGAHKVRCGGLAALETISRFGASQV